MACTVGCLRKCEGKGKGNAHPVEGHEGPGGRGGMVIEVYCFSLCLTSAVVGGGWSTPLPGRFSPGKETQGG